MSSPQRLRQSVLGVVGGAAQNSPLPNRILVLPTRDSLERIETGAFYDINHAHLPPDAPTDLYSLCVVMVSTKTDHNVTIRYPSNISLEAFFAKSDRVSIRITLFPETDEKYVMGTNLALRVLGHRIPSQQFVDRCHSKAFWLINCSNPQDPHLPPDSKAKNGRCFSMLERTGLTWGSRLTQRVLPCVQKQHHHVDEAISVVAHGDDKDVFKQEEIHEVEVKFEESPDIKVKDLIQYSKKRKPVPPLRSQYKKIKTNPKQKSLTIVPKLELNKGGRVDRWSAMRYEAAAKELVEVLKANEANYQNPIARANLRAEARKTIGDTGLLDHLLKHLAGKVVPSGGDVRLIRKCDPDGKMEYWLESADLVNIRNEAGIKDPYWTPPPGWKPGDCVNIHNCICCNEVRLLKDELSNLRRKFTEVKLKDGKQQPNALALSGSASSAQMVHISNLKANNSKESYELLAKKKSVMEEQLHTMSKALMELEKDMKKLSSKSEAEAKRNPLRISYSKNWTAQELNGTNKTNAEDFAQESSEESSDDDDEDYERESKVSKTLKPIRLRACRLPPSNNKTCDAVNCAREDLLTVTPSSASPHSTTTS